MNYESARTVESRVMPGVSFRIARMSFGRRNELLLKVREAAQGVEFFQAGDTAEDKVRAALAGAEIDRLYLEWGLLEVSGLTIDGEPADPALLCSAGPEELCREALVEIKHECGLTEQERKN